MKRLATLAALTMALLVATFARADWHQAGGLDGGPQDFWIADAGTAGAGGYFSVHTNGTAAYRMVETATTAVPVGSVSVPLGAARCTAIVNDKVRVGAQLAYVDEVGGSTPLADQVRLSGCRVTETFASVMFGTPPASGTINYNTLYRSDAGEFGLTQPEVANPDSAPSIAITISTHTIFGRDYAYVTRPNSGSLFLLDGMAVPPFFTQTITSATRSEIFGTRAGTIRAIQVGADGGQLMTLAAPSPVVFEGFGLPAALVPPSTPYLVKAATLSELEGGPNGAGFGMLLAEGAGVTNLWRAIPDPNNVGRYWVPSSVPPPSASGGIYDSVRCLDGRFCVLGSSNSGNQTQNQLALYRNQASPTVVVPPFVVQEGASGVASMTVNPTDTDGDAVFVTWTPDPSYLNYFTSLGPDLAVHDGRTWLGFPIRPNGRLCGFVQASIPLTVFGHDGLNQGPNATGSITVVHTPPGPIGANQVTGIQAGLPTATQMYTFASNGCLESTEIVPPTPATALLTSSTTLDVRFTPPRVFCDDAPDAGVRQFQVTLVEDGGSVRSAPAIATFVILPYGEPEQPFGATGRTVSQDAGSAVTYRPDATHLCEGDAGNFPGVDTLWTWTPTGVGFTPVVLQADAGLLPQGGAVTPTATVVALDCQSGSIAFQATNTTRMAGGLSASSPLTVNVTSTLLPLSGLPTVTAVPNGSVVTGQVDLAPIQCQQNRPDLSAAVELHRPDGGLISSATVPGLPAPYSLSAPGACGGGSGFYVAATVSDSTGTVGPATQPVSLPLLNPGFASVDVEPFKIACGDVARSRGSVTFGPTDCDSAQVDWSSAGAVAIAPGAVGPSNVDLATVSSDFNGLIGLPVDVVATATAESGVRSMPAAPVPIVTVDPFVTLVHRTDTAVASESRALGVEVQLTNTTSCPVTGVELHEALDGMEWLEGSVRGPDGGVVDEIRDGGRELVVPGLSLPPGETVTVRYLAQPTLFGHPEPGGVATLRGVPISERTGLTGGGSTCGCQSASGGATALVGLAAALLRRRRKVRARS